MKEVTTRFSSTCIVVLARSFWIYHFSVYYRMILFTVLLVYEIP